MALKRVFGVGGRTPPRPMAGKRTSRLQSLRTLELIIRRTNHASCGGSTGFWHGRLEEARGHFAAELTQNRSPQNARSALQMIFKKHLVSLMHPPCSCRDEKVNTFRPMQIGRKSVSTNRILSPPERRVHPHRSTAVQKKSKALRQSRRLGFVNPSKRSDYGPLEVATC
jgi:hypothetical protein